MRLAAAGFAVQQDGRAFLMAANIVESLAATGKGLGMNFRHMPELDWAGGYAWAWGLMIVMSLGTWLWFRRKGWL